MKIEDLVSRNYHFLNENDKIIWKYIVQNKILCKGMPIATLARHCNVSRTTVMRFAQKLGMAGFGELKLYLKWEDEEIFVKNEHIVETVAEKNICAIRHYAELNYDSICFMLDNAERIFAYGTGVLQKSVCDEVKRLLLTAGLIVDIIPGQGEFIRTLPLMKSGDITLIISKSGESDFIKDITLGLKDRDVKIISATTYGDNTLARRSDYNLFIDTDKVKMEGQFHYETMTLYYLLFEILFAKFVEYKDRNRRLSDNSRDL